VTSIVKLPSGYDLLESNQYRCLVCKEIGVGQPMQLQAARVTHPVSREHIRAIKAKREKDARTSERQAQAIQVQNQFMPIDLPATIETDPLVGLHGDHASPPHWLHDIIEESSALLGLGPEEQSDVDRVKLDLQSSFRLSMAARMARSMDPDADPGIMEDSDPEETSFMIKIMSQLNLAEDGVLLLSNIH
jgi:hypothetical protein